MSGCCRTRCRATLPCRPTARLTFEDYMRTRQFKPLRPGQISYWQNYRQVLRQLPEGDLRRCGARPQRLGLRLAAETRRPDLRHHPRLRDDGERRDERLHLPGLQSAAGVSRPRQDPPRARQAEVPGHHGSPGYGNLAFLGGIRPAESLRSGRHSDRSLPAADVLLRRGERLARQLVAHGCNGIGRRPGRQVRRDPTSGS